MASSRRRVEAPVLEALENATTATWIVSLVRPAPRDDPVELGVGSDTDRLMLSTGLPVTVTRPRQRSRRSRALRG